MNILIIRAFVKLREILATHKDLARKIEELARASRGAARLDSSPTPAARSKGLWSEVAASSPSNWRGQA